MNSCPCSEEEHYYKLDNMLLSSCQHLRTIFKARWKSETGKEWVDVQENVQRFLSGVGQNAFKSAKSFEKAVLKNKCVEEWDMALICMVLQNFGCSEKYKTENSALRQLKLLRNTLAHHITKKIPKPEYDEKVDIVHRCLLDLGMEEKDISSLMEKAEVTSTLQALELLAKLEEKAKHFLNKGEIQSAIGCYSEAIEIPSLLPENVAAAYEKRAECFLKLATEQHSNHDYCHQALLDTAKAMTLNDSSWIAHNLAAQCHKLQNNLEKAIYHFQRSLSISPGQAQIKNDIDSCKLLAADQNINHHLNPGQMPMNLQERLAHLYNETGIKMNEERFRKFGLDTALIKEGYDDVFRGHQHFAGWYVAQNFTEAAKYYEKAARVKNAEGMYKLALCYEHGHGVTQNIQKALRMYREVAEMPPKTPDKFMQLYTNTGVAEAQHAIGLLYDNGIGVEQNYTEASKWYRRAMENGVDHSANNLAILYSAGKGMPRDMKMAELCWKEAVNLGDPNTPASLMIYYINHMEPDKAFAMIQIGREMGNSLLTMLSDDQVNKLLADARSTREKEESTVIEFEVANNLETKGLTFKERLRREMSGRSQDFAKIYKIIKHASQPYVDRNSSWGGKAQTKISLEMLVAIHEKAEAGSETAQRIWDTIRHSNIIEAILKAGCYDTKEKKMKIINSAYKCATLEPHLLWMTAKPREQLTEMLVKLFEECCEKKGEDDMRIRLCYVMFALDKSWKSEDMYAIELLKEGIRRYPNNIHYYHSIVRILGNKQKYKEGRYFAEEALKKFPNDPGLLYGRAVHMRLERPCDMEGALNDKNDYPECKEAYEEFLKYAPSDHRKVPEAFYQISCLYSEDIRHVDQKLIHTCKEVELMREYFRRGQEAEREQLPCYLPYGESGVKYWIKNMLQLLDAKRETEITATSCIHIEIPESVMERKAYLKSPTRKSVVLNHRMNLKNSKELELKLKKLGESAFLTSREPKLSQTTVKKMSALTPITILDMNPTKDHIFKNRILDLTIIDGLTAAYMSIHLIAEDSNGDVTRLYIYNVAKNKESLEHFRAGCRIAVINPYMRIGAEDISNGIRTDDPRCIVYLKKVENMCRFCGKEGASRKCSRCKRPYCSRECQKLDWKEFGHKLICHLDY